MSRAKQPLETFHSLSLDRFPAMSSPADSDSDSDSGCDYAPDAAPAPGEEGYLYYGLGCKVCERLEAEEPDYEVGDEEKYLLPDELEDEQFKDRGLVLRLIRYRKSLATTGGFDVTCPPHYHCIGGEVYLGEHYSRVDDGFDKNVTDSAHLVIDTYNAAQMGEKLTLMKIVNACANYVGYMVLYITFECSKTCRDQGTETPELEMYHAVVACEYKSDVKHLCIFRKVSDGIDLLPADPSEAMFIKHRKLMGKDTDEQRKESLKALKK